MKIYLFHPETGIYLGEDYADDSATGRNGCMLPPHATTVAPPVAGHGSVPVFCGASGCWVVRTAAEIRGLGAGGTKKE